MSITFQPELPSVLTERTLLNDCEYLPIEAFNQDFRRSVGNDWIEIERLFNEYGKFLSIPFCSAVLYAQEDGKLRWCLDLLSKHLEEDLSYQHPELRGRLVLGHATNNRSEIFILSEIIYVLRPTLFKN